MVSYSIKDLENLSGVKAHTLRVWEKRYQIIQPSRTESNIRYYKEEDLQKILNITILNRNGFKISAIVNMTDAEIKSKVGRFSHVESCYDDHLDCLMLATFELDETKFNIILEHQISSHGFEKTIIDVLIPLLKKISLMLNSGSVNMVHQRFVHSIIKRKTAAQTDKIQKSDVCKKSKCLIYSCQESGNEIKLLFLNYIMNLHNYQVLNCGFVSSVEEVLLAKDLFNPSLICTCFDTNQASPFLTENVIKLANTETSSKLFCISNHEYVDESLYPPNVSFIHDLKQVSISLASLCSRL